MLSNLMKSYEYKRFEDDRGVLSAFNGLEGFNTKRFYIIECEKDKWRGDHYHKFSTQLITVFEGILNVEITTKDEMLSTTMKSGDTFLQIPNCKFKFKSITKTSRLLIMCDSHFDEKDYFLGNIDESLSNDLK